MKTLFRTTLMAALAAVLAAGSACARTSLLSELEDAFVSLHESVGPTVVNISVKSAPQKAPAQMEDFFKMFGVPGHPQLPQQEMPRAMATGSGFIYDAEGHIVTNNHVVEDAESITVRLYNGNEYPAEVVGTDPESDLAVIKIDAKEELPVAKLGDSDVVKVGEFAIAVGSPRGFEGSLSFGHISALGREGLDGLAMQGLAYQHLIQTDAAINLGNSGGPLCNIDGEVIGINLAIVYGANNIGFAIPVNTAKHAVPALIANGKVSRGFIGVTLSMLTADLADGLGLKDRKGALVTDVLDDQPGAKAGLKPYDVIRSVNNMKIEDAADLQRKIGRFAPGTKVQLEVWRDEKTINTSLELAERPESASLAMEQRPVKTDILGMQIDTLDSEMAAQLGLEEGAKGVLITSVEPDSAADEAQLSSGDVITEVGKKPVADARSFLRILQDFDPGSKVLIRYQRGDAAPRITVLAIPEE